MTTSIFDMLVGDRGGSGVVKCNWELRNTVIRMTEFSGRAFLCKRSQKMDHVKTSITDEKDLSDHYVLFTCIRLS